MCVFPLQSYIPGSCIPEKIHLWLSFDLFKGNRGSLTSRDHKQSAKRTHQTIWHTAWLTAQLGLWIVNGFTTACLFMAFALNLLIGQLLGCLTKYLQTTKGDGSNITSIQWTHCSRASYRSLISVTERGLLWWKCETAVRCHMGCFSFWSFCQTSWFPSGSLISNHLPEVSTLLLWSINYCYSFKLRHMSPFIELNESYRLSNCQGF